METLYGLKNQKSYADYGDYIMPSKKPQSKVLLTTAQFAAEAEAIKKSGLSASEFRRQALKSLIESFNIDFPENMPPHGGERKSGGVDNT